MDRMKVGKENSCRNNFDEVDSISYLRKLQNNSSCIECQKNQLDSCLPKNATNNSPGSNNNIIGNGLDSPTLLHANNTTTTTGRKLSDPSSDKVPKKSSLVKSITIARLFGNNYDTKQPVIEKLKKPPTRLHALYQEKFLKTDSDCVADFLLHHPTDKDGDKNGDIVNGLPPTGKPFRSLSRGFGKLIRRNYSSVDISNPDPEYKVSYLGNVLTAWAKGENCTEKPLATLWRNYTQNKKPDVVMRLKVCPSGLKASTRQHGLTEYWAHRITFCSAPKNYPRVFCWIYRHEGRKLKHELRCHAVICTKESIANDISATLQLNLATALREFKREKLNKQNARLSLVNSMYENPSMPKRKIMLSVGGTNYRPPLERSKSAPKLTAIEEAIGEEEEEENEENEATSITSDLAHYNRDAKILSRQQYQTLTLGRQRGLKSIRRKRRVEKIQQSISHEEIPTHAMSLVADDETTNENLNDLVDINISDEEFEKFLHRQEAAAAAASEEFSGELFDYLKTRFEDNSAAVDNSLLLSCIGSPTETNFKQDEVINYLASFDTNETQNLLSTDSGITVDNNNSSQCNSSEAEDQLAKEYKKQVNQFDSDPDDLSAPPSIICVSNKVAKNGVEGEGDAGSISSGCETASTITNVADETAQKPCSVLERIQSFEKLSESPKKPFVTPRRRHDSACLVRKEAKENFQRSISVPTPGSRYRTKYATIQQNSDGCCTTPTTNLQRLEHNNLESIDSDSDESGYVEYQETGICKK